MKILKITLQNINSLKSDTPIVIDFESEQFKDVGLYAITGSTGAGKTTILDAITIALYHRVPRFNAAHVKASLENVVSYGAAEAFAQVVFENNEQRYEAHWSMRLMTKSGKRMSKPLEEVRLKNLSQNKIIAEKKQEVGLEIERVTQLDYNQFLRSVMLAQGEFASFLSAKSNEKAKLLEQITGEEIYKKIGDIIVNKGSEEQTKLNEIKAKINNEDLLSDELLSELRNEKKQIVSELATLEVSIKATETIILWYQEMTKLDQQSEQLQSQQSALLEQKENQSANLASLQKNDMAEPFRGALQEYERLEKELDQQKKELLEIDEALQALTPKLASTQQESKKHEALLRSAEKSIHDWLPRLEEVTVMDTSIENLKTDESKQQQMLQVIIRKMDELKHNESNTLKSQIDKQGELTTINEYLTTYKQIPAISEQFTSWNTDLTKLKVARQNWSILVDVCNKKKQELEGSRREYAIDNQKIEKQQTELKLAEKELSVLLEQSDSQGLDLLMSTKEQLTHQYQAWIKMGELSKRYLDLEKEKGKLQQAKLENSRSTSKLTEAQKLYEQDLTIATKTVEDAEKIVLLEMQVKAFSEERKKLEHDKPCHLCGSTEHPYVSHYDDTIATGSDQELVKRKKSLENLRIANAENDKKLTALQTVATNQNARLHQIDHDQNELTDQSKQLDLSCDLTSLKIIQQEILSIQSEVKKAEGQMKAAQSLLKQKSDLEEIIALKKANLSKLEVALAAITERGKNMKDELATKELQLQSDGLAIETLEAKLNDSFSPFHLNVPVIDQIDRFIEQMQHDIAAYNEKTKKATTIKADLEVIETKLAHTKKELNQKQNEQQETLQALDSVTTKTNDLIDKRNTILPKDITVQSKRENLAAAVEEAKVKHDNSEKMLTELQLKKENKSSQKLLTAKLMNSSGVALKKVTSQLASQIDASDFGNIEEVKSAMLSNEHKQELVELKEEINNKTVELNTLSTKLKSEKTILAAQQNFDATADEALSQQSHQKENKDTLLQRSGEIMEQFATNDRIVQRNKGVIEEIATQDKVYQKWADLLSLLGGTKDAFNKYVQRLTLKNLIGFANIHLYKLNKRYALIMEDTYKKNEELNFKLIDHYQTDQTRPVDTTSGGEKFLISLSLALGLSDLASNNVNIDSLFIDEGFGTLDNHTLETVISTLETLQSQGKMIGIISHVENLKERIPTQIQVSKRSNGVSVVEVV